MTGFLRQQRFSAFVAGVGTAAALYAATKTYYWRVTEETAAQLPGAAPRKASEAPQVPEPVFGEVARTWAVRRWNEGVDAVFKPVVEALSKRNL